MTTAINPPTPAHDPARVLLDHNEWANRLLIEACAPLTDQQLDHPFEMGLGTLRKTITHTFGAIRGWTDLLAKQPSRERLETTAPIGMAEWRVLVETTASELKAAAFCGPMDEVLHTERAGKSYSFVRSHVIVHITTHGVHHRAQCLNMLRQLGITDLPANSGMQWSMAQA
jgi:uncharacterized damage-inducible protein DinB